MNKYSYPSYQELLENISMPPGRRKVILACVKLFSSQGYNATTTAQISEEAGVSQGTIFKYFKTKEDILLAICESMVELVGMPFVEKVSKCNNVEEMVSFIVNDRIAFVKSNQELIKIFFQETMILPVLRNKVEDLFRQQAPKIIEALNKILLNDESLDNTLTHVEQIRAILAPLFIYGFQRFILGLPAIDEESDLKSIEKQILKVLRS